MQGEPPTSSPREGTTPDHRKKTHRFLTVSVMHEAFSRSRLSWFILRNDSMSFFLCLRSLYLPHTPIVRVMVMMMMMMMIVMITHDDEEEEDRQPWCGIPAKAKRPPSIAPSISIPSSLPSPLLLAGSEDEVGVGVVDGGHGPEASKQRLLDPLSLRHPVRVYLLHHLGSEIITIIVIITLVILLLLPISLV
jgi:hypothetical protein